MESNKYLLFFYVILATSLSSCELFAPTQVSSTEIKKASSWSSKDQPPTYAECDTLAQKEQLDCFQSIISEQLLQFISESNLIAKSPIDEEIVVQLKIDKEGFFSLAESQIPNTVKKALPELSTVLQQAVANLPKALPATKTNVGVYVDAQFSMPVHISAQPVE